MADAPITLEGWWTLHEIWSVDWGRWNALDAADRDAIAAEAAAVLEAFERPEDGHGAAFSLLGKGDLALVHFRRDPEGLRRAELAWSRTRLRGYLTLDYAYFAVVELGTYELGAQAKAMLARKGVVPETEGFEARVEEEMQRLARPRLYPEVPDKRWLCFYPMSKRRGEQVNWYDLSGAERGAFMKGHGEIGRKYAGKVVQIIQGSTGLDDWEWAVSLFADDPLTFKKLVYEMRFDAASSRFALFGPFYVGHRLAPARLGAMLAGEPAGA